MARDAEPATNASRGADRHGRRQGPASSTEAKATREAGGRGSGAGRARRCRARSARSPTSRIVNLPTTLRLPRYKSSFRVTHRFTRPLGAGRLRRPARGLLRLRRRRADRPRIPLRHHERHAGRHSPHQRPDDPVLRAVRACKPQSESFRSASTPTRPSTAPTTSATAIRRRSAWSSRATWAARRGLRAADLDQQHQPAAERAGRRQQHVHHRLRRAAAGAADPLRGRRGGAAVRV